jgi:hypothetical protein
MLWCVEGVDGGGSHEPQASQQPADRRPQPSAVCGRGLGVGRSIGMAWPLGWRRVGMGLVLMVVVVVEVMVMSDDGGLAVGGVVGGTPLGPCALCSGPSR